MGDATIAGGVEPRRSAFCTARRLRTPHVQTPCAGQGPRQWHPKRGLGTARQLPGLVGRAGACDPSAPHTGLSLVPSPQDAEISAFELQTILRRVLAKRKCPLLAKPSPRPALGPRWLRHGSLCSHTNATGHHWHRGRRHSAG